MCPQFGWMRPVSSSKVGAYFCFEYGVTCVSVSQVIQRHECLGKGRRAVVICIFITEKGASSYLNAHILLISTFPKVRLVPCNPVFALLFACLRLSGLSTWQPTTSHMDQFTLILTGAVCEWHRKDLCMFDSITLGALGGASLIVIATLQ